MEFAVLGPLEVREDGRAIALPAGKQRELLAIFVLRANERLGAERLSDELWGAHPPATAANTLQVYVSRLRKLLGDGPARLSTVAGGYVLEVDPDRIDARRFEELAETARRSPEPEVSARLLAEALALWRGPALAELSFGVEVAAEVERLNEARIGALEDRIDADLALGRHSELVAELESAVSEHPLRERLRGQLMLALYRSGRQAEALEAYRQTRAVLVEGLGIEPGKPLQRLEQAILRQDASLEAPPRRGGPPDPGAPARTQRKTVTVLAARAAQAPSADPEVDAVRLAEALREAGRILARHGAAVEHHGAEGVIGVFGVPAVHEDDPLRAARAAAELAAGLLLVGIETGPVLATDERVVSGAPLSEAIRLREAAAPGEALLGEEALRRLSGAVGVDGSRLVEVAAGAEAVRRSLDTPLVGRDRELGELREALSRARSDRRSYAVTVIGPAGIGKSRLAAELRAAVAGEATVLGGKCLPYGDGITFWPLAEIVSEAAGGEAPAHLEGLLAGQGDAGLVAGRLAAALGFAEGTTRNEDTFWAARRLFETLARRHPLVLVLDDLQWAEPTLLRLVEHLVERASDAPLLVLGLARPELRERAPEWAGPHSNVAVLPLEPLADEAAEALVGSLPGGADIPARDRRRIVDAADGNPLFLEHMVAVVAEGEVGPSVPPSIEALIAARLDGLPPDEQLALQVGSVLGRDFWGDAVDALAPELGGRLDEALDGLVRRDLVRPGRGVLRERRPYQIAHTLVRDVAYESLPKAVRARLHEEAADWIGQATGTRASEYEEILGYHLGEAVGYRAELGPADEELQALAVRAAVRLGSGGRRALARGDIPAAVRLLRRAVDLTPEADPTRFDLLADLAEAEREHGDFDAADRSLVAALALAAEADDATRQENVRLMQLGMLTLTDPAEAVAQIPLVVEAAIPALQRARDDRRLAQAWFLLGWRSWLLCRAADGRAAFERAVRHGERAGLERETGRALHMIVGTALYGPTPVAEAIELCERIGRAHRTEPRLVSATHRANAALRAMEGHFEEARRLVARDREILEHHGLAIAAASAADVYGTVELLAGDAAAAEALFRAGYERFEQMGERSNSSTLAAQLGEALFRLGRLDDAVAMSEASEATAAPDDLHTHVQWRGPRAKVLSRRGEGKVAERLAREGVELAEQTDFFNMHAAALLDLADVLAVNGRPRKAREAAAAAAELYERKGNVVGAELARAFGTTPTRAGA